MCLGMVFGRDLACAVVSGARGHCNCRSEPMKEHYEMHFKHDATKKRKYLTQCNLSGHRCWWEDNRVGLFGMVCRVWFLQLLFGWADGDWSGTAQDGPTESVS